MRSSRKEKVNCFLIKLGATWKLLKEKDVAEFRQAPVLRFTKSVALFYVIILALPDEEDDYTPPFQNKTFCTRQPSIQNKNTYS